MTANSIATKGIFWQTAGDWNRSILSIGKLPFELVLEGLDFLLLLKLLFGKRLAGHELVVFQLNGEKGAAFPALVRALIACLNQRYTALSLAGRTFNLHQHIYILHLFILMVKSSSRGGRYFGKKILWGTGSHARGKIL
jgi:hypothetical protein